MFETPIGTLNCTGTLNPENHSSITATGAFDNPGRGGSITLALMWNPDNSAPMHLKPDAGEPNQHQPVRSGSGIEWSRVNKSLHKCQHEQKWRN
jgi:hypothetical protein